MPGPLLVPVRAPLWWYTVENLLLHPDREAPSILSHISPAPFFLDSSSIISSEITNSGSMSASSCGISFRLVPCVSCRRNKRAEPRRRWRALANAPCAPPVGSKGSGGTLSLELAFPPVGNPVALPESSPIFVPWFEFPHWLREIVGFLTANQGGQFVESLSCFRFHQILDPYSSISSSH